MSLLITVISFFFLGYFAWKRLRSLLHFYQQEEYDTARFFPFCFANFGQLIDKKLSAILLLLLLAAIFLPILSPTFLVSVLAVFYFALREKDPTKHGKKKLAMTRRAWRIFTLAFILSMIFAVLVLSIPPKIWAIVGLLCFVQFMPLALIAGNFLLSPYEKTVQKKFRDEAVAILEKHNPVIIGITGSYGKTSVKHILAHILQSAAPTLSTPGSINTEMGITRIIREQLKAEHRFFIVEMGAYGIGSIERLCQLTPPHHGILTAIGNAHYERFKTLENVAQAKFELHHAVKLKKGCFIVNLDQVPQEFIKAQAGTMADNKLVTVGQSGRYRLRNIEQSAMGMAFTLIKGAGDSEQEQIYDFEAPLYGAHQISNAALAVVMALELGIQPQTIRAALKTAPQIKHRLEVQKYAGSATIIDDAYNANPTGFESALDILELLGNEKKGRKILVTPGMVELGALHDEKHRELGRISGSKADLVVVIKPERIESFIYGVRETIKDTANIMSFESFQTAKSWLDKHVQPNDVILYENDLPDLYESKISL